MNTITPFQPYTSNINCGPGQPPPRPAVPDCYTKEQALDALLKAEGDANEARSDFRVIQGNLKGDEALKDATEQFLRVLYQEGTNYTSLAQKDYEMIGNFLKPGETRKDAVDQFLKLMKAEGNRDDAVSDYILINRYVSPKETREQATDQFMRLLYKVGTGYTNQAQNNFILIH
ncbi:MAG: hypothetical protein HYU64_04380 [Armatimonadetes bacterium]|nr:hypothetical protein [Armatimonadota bacterium]